MEYVYYWSTNPKPTYIFWMIFSIVAVILVWILHVFSATLELWIVRIVVNILFGFFGIYSFMQLFKKGNWECRVTKDEVTLIMPGYKTKIEETSAIEDIDQIITRGSKYSGMGQGGGDSGLHYFLKCRDGKRIYFEDNMVGNFDKFAEVLKDMNHNIEEKREYI